MDVTSEIEKGKANQEMNMEDAEMEKDKEVKVEDGREIFYPKDKETKDKENKPDSNEAN